jgi:hypothetical protein
LQRFGDFIGVARHEGDRDRFAIQAGEHSFSRSRTMNTWRRRPGNAPYYLASATTRCLASARVFERRRARTGQSKSVPGQRMAK